MIKLPKINSVTMDNDNQRKPRTIQMKYPAPYSQSWPENQNTGVGKNKSKLHNPSHVPAHSQSRANDRNAKRPKGKLPSPRGNTQLVYPLPFSKLGVNSERKTVRPRKSTTRQRSGQKLSSDPFSGSEGPWQPAKPKIRGPDPTAPHLKYGLFPPPNKNSNKSQIQVLSATLPEPKSRLSTSEHASSKKDKKGKMKKSPAPEGEAPMFVFRAIDPRYTRQLSVSTPTHVDIRPRLLSKGAPLYAPAASPSHTAGRAASQIANKNNAPTLSISPLKKSFQVLPKKDIK